MPPENELIVKPGWKTTEFWLSAVTVILSLLWGAGVIDPEAANGSTANRVVALVASALAAVGYTVSRGMAKKG